MGRRRLTPEEQAYAKAWIERRRDPLITEFRWLGRVLIAMAVTLFVLAVWLL